MTRNQWLVVVALLVVILIIVFGMAFDFNINDNGRD